MKEEQENFEFGEYRIDGQNKRLMRGSENVPLTPKVFETLQILVQNAGNLVGKSELMELIWPDRFVEESNLTFNIKMLRKALGDSSNDPKFIETVPRRGYRFIAEMNKPIELAADQVETQPRTARRRLLFATTATAICAMAVAGFALWQQRASAVNASPLSFASTRLTESGNISQAVLSHDGELVAYSSHGNGKESLWLRDLASGSNTQVLQPTDDSYTGLTFSRDNKAIYFVRVPKDRSSGAAIYSLPTNGGIPTKIADRTEGWIDTSPDGKLLSFVQYVEGKGDLNKLMLMNVDGTNARVVMVSAQPSVYWVSSFSPDGKKLVAAYGRSNTSSKEMMLVEIDIETNSQRTVSENFFYISDVQWLEDGSVLFNASEKIGDPSRIWKLDRVTGKGIVQTDAGVSYWRISCGNTCDKMVATTISPDFRIYSVDTKDARTIRELAQARDGLAHAPDGKIVYASDSAGTEDIWIMNADGTQQRQLTTGNGVDSEPLVSPDGRTIIFTSNRSGASRLWRMNIDGSNQTQISNENGGIAISFSQDSQSIFYKEAVTGVIWKISTSGGQAVAVFDQRYGYDCVFSVDGTKFAYLEKDKQTQRFVVKMLETSTAKLIAQYELMQGESRPYSVRFSPDGNSIMYVAEGSNGQNTLWQQPINEPRPKQMLAIGPRSTKEVELSPDGSFVTFIRGQWEHDAVLLERSK